MFLHQATAVSDPDNFLNFSRQYGIAVTFADVPARSAEEKKGDKNNAGQASLNTVVTDEINIFVAAPITAQASFGIQYLCAAGRTHLKPFDPEYGFLE